MEPLEIIISAIDETEGAFASVSEDMEGLAATTSETTAEMEANLNEFGLTMNSVTGEIEESLMTQQQSFDMAAAVVTQDDQEIIDVMLATGTTAQEAAAIIEEANATIAASTDETSAEVTAATGASKGGFMALGAFAAIAVTGLVSAIGDAISQAQAWSIESANITQELKDTGSAIPTSQVQEYAKQVQSVTLLTQQQALQAEGLILSYSNLQGNYQSLTLLSADLATKMSQVSGTMTDNLPNATKILVNALEDPVAGINQLIRQGTVDFPAATVTMIENMAKAGDTAGADAIIMKALGDSVGGMAEKAAQAPGAGITQMQNSLSALGTQIGLVLLPDLDAIAKAITPIIVAISNWVAAHPKLVEAILAAIVVFGLLIAAVVAVGLVIVALAVPFVAVAVAITGAVAIIVGIVVDNWSLIEDKTKELWSLMDLLFKSGLAGIQTIWQDGWNLISTIVTDIWNTIGNTVKTGVNDVINAINAFINALDSLHINIPAITIPGTKLGTPAVDLGFNIPDIPMLAAGGIVYNPTMAMIGEQGPEAVVPLSSYGGGIGQGQQIVINIQGGTYLDRNGADTIAQALARQINRQIKLSSAK